MVYANHLLISDGSQNDNYSVTTPNERIWSTTNYNQTSQSLSMQRASSDVMKTRSLNDVMEEFRRNGVDSPYDPDEEFAFSPISGMLDGMCPSSTYLRQKSWPEPERTPIQRLRPAQWNPPHEVDNFPQNQDNQLQRNDDVYPFQPFALLTQEQSRVLSTLPDVILYTLLKCLEKTRNDLLGKTNIKDNTRWEAGQGGGGASVQGCRFCRNNGERDGFVRSHNLKDPYGRVTCPVLRAFVCTRCGAQGDYAHTIKYCPYSSTEERYKSTAIMRSMRMASGRRRYQTAAPSVDSAENYVLFGEPTPSVIQDPPIYNYMPLDPLWAALEQKLSM